MAETDDWQPISSTPSGADDWQPVASSAPTSEPSPNMDNEKRTIANAMTGQITAPSAVLQTMGNMASAGWDAAGRAVKSIPGYDTVAGAASAVGNAAQRGAQSVADYIGDTSGAQAIGDVGMAAENKASDFAKAHPELTDDAIAIAKLLPLEPGVGAVESGLKAASENTAYNEAAQAAKRTGILPSTQAILDDHGLDAGQIAAMTPQQRAKVKSGMYAQGIASNIEDARKLKNGIYSMADEVGNDSVFSAPDTQSTLDNLYQKFSADPAYDGTPLVRRLGSWKEMFNDDGTITPTRLNKLKDQIDDAYRENPKAPEGEVYQSISGPVNGAVNTAKQQFPNWGTLIDTADDAHYNLMKSTRDDTAFTGKWSPDSHKDFQTNMNKGNNAGDLMGSTQRQISSMSTVKDEAELQKMMAFVPQELQGQFLTDVAKNSGVPSKIKKMVKAVLYTSRGNYGWGLSNLMDAMPSKAEIEGWDPDAATHISDRMAQWKNAADEAYQNHVDEMAAKQGANASTRYQASRAQRMLPNPGTPLALPAPNILKSGWSGADTQPMTGEDLARAQAGRESWPALHPGEAQPPAAYGDPREPIPHSGSWLRNFMRENKGRPMSSTQGQEYVNPEAKNALENIADPEYADFLKRNGYAKGGAISEAQKKAGNYPKDHIKFQGLDISIENKKGSIRSGKDKGGKEWSVKMPAAYGYFKRSEAADGDHVDCYIGPHEKSNRVYIIDQHHLHNGAYDEAKCMVGFASRDEAVSTYKAGFSDGKGHQRIGKVTRMSMAEFKDWLKNGNTKKPVKEAA